MSGGWFLDALFGFDDDERRARDERVAKLDIALDQIDHLALIVPTMHAQFIRVEEFLMASGNWETFDARLNALVEGFRASTALNRVYEAQIADADKKTQSAVADAIAKDDAADQEKIDSAADALDEGLNPPVDPVVPDSSPDVPGSEAPPQVQANPSQGVSAGGTEGDDTSQSQNA